MQRVSLSTFMYRVEVLQEQLRHVLCVCAVEYFHRCIWERQVTTVTLESCLSPPALAGQSKASLESSNQWEQCITKNVTSIAVTIGEAQPDPTLELLFQ